MVVALVLALTVAISGPVHKELLPPARRGMQIACKIWCISEPTSRPLARRRGNGNMSTVLRATRSRIEKIGTACQIIPQ